MNSKKIFAAYIIFTIATIAIVNSGITSELRNWLNIKIPLLDKIGHFFGMGILAFLVHNTFSKQVSTVIAPRFILGVISILIISTLEEYSQKYIDARTFQYLDLVANYLGIIFFSVLHIVINNNRKLFCHLNINPKHKVL